MTGPGRQQDDGTVAAVLRLADLAARIERADARIGELARDRAAADERIAELRDALAALAGRAGQADRQLAELAGLLGRLTDAMTAPAGGPDDETGYRVNQPPPWWKPADERCAETEARLADWVSQVYRPVYGYLSDLLAPCWQQHPLCLAYLDVLHEAWCLLFLNRRDAKMVFAQLDWLTRGLLQAAEVMASETRRCRDYGRHREPGRAIPAAGWQDGRR